MEKRNNALMPTRFMLECAPMGKYTRLIHDFAFKKNLPAGFVLWAFISGPAILSIVISNMVRAATSDFERTPLGTFISYILPMILLVLLFALLKWIAKPTHICITPQGVANYWSASVISHFGKVLKWKDIRRIDFFQPRNTSRIQSRMLRFSGSKRVVEVKIDEIRDISMLPMLYEAIIKYADNVPRDPELQSILGADRGHESYTELWLNALTAPPERSRLAPLSPGTELQAGEYKIEELIGAGGQGVAYTAKRRSGVDGEIVVLKEYVLPVGVSHGSKVESLEKFQKEAQILGQLDHPQIVKLHDFFFEDHRGYMVLEYIDGTALNSVVQKSGPMAEADVVRLALQMTNILAYLHSRVPAVIHRDFTPDNIILTADGTIKLIDFNVAQQKKQTVTATIVGKHAYIAPDQFRGQVSPQSDIYSFGATLCFLLTGSDPKPITESHPKEKNATTSTGLDKIVAGCTAIDTSARFPSAEKVADALRQLPVSAGFQPALTNQ